MSHEGRSGGAISAGISFCLDAPPVAAIGQGRRLAGGRPSIVYHMVV
jgi:hypothetical protein